MISVQYPNILTLIDDHIIKGREESASFLIWYLENYYRLDTQEAIDSVCDQSGDKGVDGIYVNEADGTIDIFQTKISQNNTRKIGDTVLKEFFGTLSQFSNRQNIQNVIATGGSAQVVSLIKRLQLVNIAEQYRVRGIFVSNIELDSNGQSYLDSISNIEFVGKHKLETTFISHTRSVPQDITASFDISGVNTLVYHVDSDTSAFIAPIKATELVNMQGIADQSVFAYNVRGPLGKTNVNKDIIASIKEKSIHKKFPLFHNGITIVANEIDESENGKLKIKTFNVVNGCQSLTALYNNRNSLTGDLKILTKFIQVSVDSELSKTITHYSNNQNGVKTRDFKSNHFIQIRLQNEFSQYYIKEFFYEVKRGEQNNGLPVISNEVTGIYLMAFDLKEPWYTPFRNRVFDDKYSDIFGRPEVSAHRMVLLHVVHSIINDNMDKIKNKLVAKYALTGYAIMYMLRLILESDEEGRMVLSKPENYIYIKQDRENFKEIVNEIIGDIIIDLNGELEEIEGNFDYRSKLRNENWVKDISKTIVNSYLKQVSRGRIGSFSNEWRNKKININ